MSSFKRKSGPAQKLPTGTRSSPSSSLTVLTSTGIPSLDDILGGGLPLSCSLVVLAPDIHSAYGQLVSKYFIAQGLACGQRVCIIDDDAKDLVERSMWIPTTAPQDPLGGEDEDANSRGEKIKIAWRYEKMKQFQTTVSSVPSPSEDYCRTFDLTCRIPGNVVEDSLRSDQLMCIDISSANVSSGQPSSLRVMNRLTELLARDESTQIPLRICIPSLGSPQWGDLTTQQILCFLYSLRRLLREYPHACASICLSPNFSTDVWDRPGWPQKLGWLSDAAVTLTAFSANPSLMAIFPTHHGLLHLLSLPAPHTLAPPSDRLSTLRGLSSAGATSSPGGGGENNLAFRCTRKRLVFETLHLDLEGGVGERRTKPSTNAIALEEAGGTAHTALPVADRAALKADRPTVEVALEGVTEEGRLKEMPSKAKKPKKQVAFRSDRPELYDF